MLCILRPKSSNAPCHVASVAHADALERARLAEGDAKAAGRCRHRYVGEDGSVVTFETPVTGRGRTSGIAKVSECYAENSVCVSTSSIRNAQSGLFRRGAGMYSTTASCSGTCSETRILTDACLVPLRIKQLLAAERWGKAGSVLNGVRLLRILEALCKSRKAWEATSTDQVMKCAKYFMSEDSYSLLPREQHFLKDSVLKNACQDILGTFAFVYMNSSQKIVFAARSADGSVPLFWMICPHTGALLFSTEETSMPLDMCTQAALGKTWGTVPPGSYCVGTTGQETLEFFQFGGRGDLQLEDLEKADPHVNSCDVLSTGKALNCLNKIWV